MHILNIAEKPSVAKSISKILSQSIVTSRGKHKYCPNITFKYNNDTFTFTSVLGHIYNLNFCKKYIWESIDPKILFYEPLTKKIQEDFINLQKNLEEQSYKANKVIIWTDCDREGEHIAQQIYNIIKSKNNIEIKRARFNAISRNDVTRALENLVNININEADAVDCRMEMDLRIGSSFTILQTLTLKSFFKSRHVISFGPCQIPTLGFVIERFFQIEKFKEEDFYSLEINIKSDTWTWKRGNIFDKNCITYFYNMLINYNLLIIKKEVSSVSKMKPLPLRTVELQKLCSSIFKISSHKIMEIAESLYNKGYISYPRTETDAFPKNFNYKNILDKIISDSTYTDIILSIKNNINLPRSGKNNDMAHSPIYPLKGGGDLTGLDRKLYDFITRRFLGSLCADAKGLETYYELLIKKEIFYIKGLKITERNYLDVYTFDKWNNKEIQDYELNKEIKEFSIEIKNGRTTPPYFLTESELITLMDKNGIGTDATIHEHIQKIQERGYVYKFKNYIIPKKLGIGLIKGFIHLNMEVNKPFLRRDLEINLKKICLGEINKKSVIDNEINTYLKLYIYFNDNIKIFREVVENTIKSKIDVLDKFNISDDESSDNKKGDVSFGDIKKVKDSKVNKESECNNFKEGECSNFKDGECSKKVKDGKFKENECNKKVKDIIFKVNKENECNEKDENKIKVTCKREHNNKKEEYNKTKFTSKKEEYNKTKFISKKEVNDLQCFCKVPSQYYCEDTQLIYKCGLSPQRCHFTKIENVKCNCNFEPKILMSFTEANKNRKFFKCKKAYKPCKFFKWAESSNN